MGRKKENANQSKKRKSKKRDSIRSRHSRKTAKEISKLYSGYRKNIGVDKNGMILTIHSVAANAHDSRGLNSLISKLGYKLREVYAKKGYEVLANVSYFHNRGINQRPYMEESYRNCPLSRIAILFKIISE
ncbi:MAG: transposase [Flavobacteriales bacterium Tduv]